jgi:hypothetical protein
MTPPCAFHRMLTLQPPFLGYQRNPPARTVLRSLSELGW